MQARRGLTALLCLWDGWRPVYDVRHVRAAARMLREYVRLPLTIALLADRKVERSECDCDVILPIPDDPKIAARGPANCFRRLRFFSREFQEQLGSEWLMSFDLDTLVLEDVTAQLAWAMDEGFGFAAQRGSGQEGRAPYAGSLYLIERGRHHRVWDEVGPDTERLVAESGWVGSDQVVISLALSGAPTLGPEDGFWFRRLMDEVESPAVLHYTHGLKPWSARERQDLRQHWERFAA